MVRTKKASDRTKTKSFRQRAAEKGLSKREAASQRVAIAKGQTARAAAIGATGQSRLSPTPASTSGGPTPGGAADPSRVTIFGATTPEQQLAATITAKQTGAAFGQAFAREGTRQLSAREKESQREAQARAVISSIRTPAEPIRSPGLFTRGLESAFGVTGLSTAKAIARRKESQARTIIGAAGVAQDTSGTVLLAPGTEPLVSTFSSRATRARAGATQIESEGFEARASRKIAPFESTISKGIRSTIPIVSEEQRARGIPSGPRAVTLEKPGRIESIRRGLDVGATQFSAGAARSITEKPVTIAAKTALFAGLTLGLGPLAAGATRGAGAAAGLATKLGVSAKVITGVSGAIRGAETLGAVGLPVFFAARTGERIAAAPKGQRAFRTGELFATDIAPIIGGAIIGTSIRSGLQRVGGIIRTRGLKEVPAESIIPRRTLEGRETFPLAPKKVQPKLFKESKAGKSLGIDDPVVFTASPQPLPRDIPRGVTIKASESEFPGLFTAPFVSPRFLRVTSAEKTRFFGTRLFEPSSIGRPTASLIKPTGVEVAPFKVLSKSPFRAVFRTPKPGVAQIPLLKTEVEAILPPGTILREAGPSRFFFRFQGQRVPIEEFIATPGVASPATLGAGLGTGSSLSSGAITSVVSPALFGVPPIRFATPSTSRVPTTRSSVTSAASSRAIASSIGFAPTSRAAPASRRASPISRGAPPSRRATPAPSRAAPPVRRAPPSSPFRPAPPSRAAPVRSSLLTSIIPTPTTGIDFSFKPRRRVSKRRTRTFSLERVFKFQPSIVGIETRTTITKKEAKEKVLSGFEVRGIPI